MVQNYLRFIKSALIFTIVFVLISCAGLRLSSSKKIGRAPFYDGETDIDSKKIGHLPIKFDNYGQESKSGLKRDLFLLPLSEEMNVYLKELNLSAELPQIDLAKSESPNVYVNARKSDKSNEDPSMYLHKLAPSETWKGKLKELTTKEDFDYVLFITLGFSDFLIKQDGFITNKYLELGTNNSLKAKWFGDTNTPAEVLYVSGALINKDGKIIKCGVEGIIAQETGFFTSQFGMQEMIGDNEVRDLLNETREDLKGHPLKWKVSLKNLVAQLLNRSDLIEK